MRKSIETIVWLIIIFIGLRLFKNHYNSQILKNGKVTVAKVMKKESMKVIEYEFKVNDEVHNGKWVTYRKLPQGTYLLYYDSTRINRRVLIGVEIKGYNLGDELDTIYPLNPSLLRQYN